MKKLGLTMIAAAVVVFAIAMMSPAGAVDYPPTTVVPTTVANLSTGATQSMNQSAATTAPAEPGLPRTGTDAGPLLWLGGALVAGGVVLATRHRRRAARS